MQKIAVYLPDHFIETVESIAQQHLQPTSVFIRQVLVDYVRVHEEKNKENIKKDVPAAKPESDWLVKSNRLSEIQVQN